MPIKGPLERNSIEHWFKIVLLTDSPVTGSTHLGNRCRLGSSSGVFRAAKETLAIFNGPVLHGNHILSTMGEVCLAIVYTEQLDHPSYASVKPLPHHVLKVDVTQEAESIGLTQGGRMAYLGCAHCRCRWSC